MVNMHKLLIFYFIEIFARNMLAKDARTAGSKLALPLKFRVQPWSHMSSYLIK